MKKLLVTFLLTILSFVTYSQSGVGYVNYTSYKTHNGTGVTNQYNAHPNNAAEFDAILNTANSNTTITHTGEVALSIMCDGSTQTPHWYSEFYAIKFEFWFIPTQTGSYSFGINSDDASDISVDGTIISTYYGGHGSSAYQYGSKSMIAGTRYKIVARYQEYGGGDALFVRWSRPNAPNTYSYWNEEVTNINSTPTKKAVANFNLNTNITATTFAVGSALSSVGSVDITTLLDSTKISNGTKGTIVGGGVEWSYVDLGATTSTLHIDMRKFGNTTPSSVSQIKLLDVYDGSVTYISNDGTWANYSVPSSLPKVTNGTSTNNQYIRNGGGYYAFACEVTFASVMAYKPQSITLTTTNNISTLYNSIVTVSDVYLAFKELANGGIFGNQSGLEFVYGIQYKNADINDDGYFNEADCFKLLQNLTGVANIVDSFTLPKTLRLITSDKYNTIGKSNWKTIPTPLGNTYSFDINTNKSIDTFNISAAWKGDVNLSHSTTPPTNGITNMSVRTSMSNSISSSTDVQSSIMTELSNGKVYAYITFDPLQQNVVGTQFQLNYDNSVLKFEGVEFKTKGSPMNYGTNKGTFINLGSLITDGNTSLDNTTEYKIIFTSAKPITNTLGLMGVGATDAVSKDGKQLKLKVN